MGDGVGESLIGGSAGPLGDLDRGLRRRLPRLRGRLTREGGVQVSVEPLHRVRGLPPFLLGPVGPCPFPGEFVRRCVRGLSFTVLLPFGGLHPRDPVAFGRRSPFGCGGELADRGSPPGGAVAGALPGFTVGVEGDRRSGSGCTGWCDRDDGRGRERKAAGVPGLVSRPARRRSATSSSARAARTVSSTARAASALTCCPAAAPIVLATRTRAWTSWCC